MAAFATMAAAEARCIAQMEAEVWVVAHSCRDEGGTIGVRVQRPMSPTNRGYGAWVFISDDGTS
jgi:hypothetical protein